MNRDRQRLRLRRMVLTSPAGTFLRRWAIEGHYAGVFLHSIESPDPGLDLHDHPWPFVSIVLRGGYTEEHEEARQACSHALWALNLETNYAELGVERTATRGARRRWSRFSIHRIRMTEAHRITDADPGTLTLVLRGPKTRQWGFYTEAGFVMHTDYDYRRRGHLTVLEKDHTR